MFTRIITSLTLCAALLATLAGGAFAQRESRELLRDEFHQTYKLTPDGRITLHNINGPVHVQGWEREEVRVEAVKTAYRRERLDEARIEVNANDDSFDLRTRYPYESMTFTDEAPRRYDNPANVEYTLTVPRGARIESIELINGALDLAGLAGEINASSINGRVTARELSGAAKLSTINGPLEATFTRLDPAHTLSLNSVNGTVTLVIPSDANASVKANTVHGTITNDFGLPVRHGRFVGTDLAGQIGQGGPRIRLGNVNGTIQLRHAQDGRSLSPVVSELSAADNEDYGPSEADIQRQVAREIERAQREAERARAEGQRAAEEGQRAAERAQRDAQREVERAQREAERAQAQAQRDAEQAQRDAEQAQREALRAGEDARREAERERAEALREAERERQEAEREAARERAEAQREAEQARQEALRTQEEARREAEEARREAERERAEALRETERERREAERERERALHDAERARTEVEQGNWYGSDYRLVERETKTFNVTGTPRVRVETFDGPVTVEAWDRPEVQYTAIKRARDEQAMRGVHVRATQSGSDIVIAAEFDKSLQRVWNGPGATVALELRVPRSANLDIHTGDGRVRLTGVRGELELRTGDGAMDVVEGGGRLHAVTGDGRISVAGFNGEADVQSGDGRIVLEGRFSRLAARTSDGGISLTLPAGVDATIETDAGLVVNDGLATSADNSNEEQRVRRWRVGRGGAVFTLRTSDGSIYLRRADGAAARR